MITIRVSTGVVRRQLADAQRQIPFAIATGLNDLAFQVMRAENAAMSTVFAKPRPFTKRATQVERKARKSNLVATVSLRKAQAKYLQPYETGGQHVTPGKGLLVPVDARLDQYGQLPKGAIARFAARPDVFVGTVHGITGFWQRPPKGQQRAGTRGTKGALGTVAGKRTGLRLLLRFGENKPVRKRLGFKARAVKLVRSKGSAAMRRAVAKALATMKK